MTSPEFVPEFVRPRRDMRCGIYVHIPFCERVCPYCDFAVTATKKIAHEAYADAVIRELGERRSELAGRDVHTIYFGGGTPSRLDPVQLARILEFARGLCERPELLAEVSIEANPVDITRAALDVWAAAGVSRLSIGCQSFDDAMLARLGRNHDGERAVVSVELALSYAMRASIDLIFGGPEQTDELWASDLEVARGLIADRGLDHVSAYNLTIESGTPFARMAAHGKLSVPGEDACAGMVEAMREVFAAVGVSQYEVSSWSKPGRHSVHNSGYWLGCEYLGVGTGAHSLRVERDAVSRRENARGLKAYLDDPVGSGVSERVSAREHFDERVFVGVRTRLGLDLVELEHQFGSLPDGLTHRIERLVDAGLLEHIGDRVAPTREGLLVCDALGESLLP